MPRKNPKPSGLRLGLCCLFVAEPDIRFRTTTARVLSRFSSLETRSKLLALAHANAVTSNNAIRACCRLGIRAFRITSGLLPLATHPDYLYGIDDLPTETVSLFSAAGALAREANIRLSFHPDQFVLLGSLKAEVTAASLRDLELHGDLAQLLGADAINLHAGGAYGNKAEALDRVARNLTLLSPRVRGRLTLENDDRVFHVRDLLPLCQREGVPLTYDVHHHRCNPDGLSIAEATRESLTTWDREPLFHVSSPRGGWSESNPRCHADMIDPADFPMEWRRLTLTVDVEAKAKEKAVLELKDKLRI